MLIGYVCTNFNTSAITERAIETLRANDGHEIEIVVVDNASAAEDVARLKVCERPGVEVVCLAENVGYFAGLNAGIRRLREKRPDIEWMAIGNNDLEFPADFGDRLQSLTPELRRYPVISPDIVTAEGEHQNPHVITAISKTREAVHDLYYSHYWLGMAVRKAALAMHRFTDRSDEQAWQEARTIHQGHGSVYILGPRFFELFEELWAPTFLMSEEYFLSKQLADVGEMVYYDPRLRVRHLWHASMDKLPSRKRWELARDAHRTYRKYVKVFG